MWLIQSAGPSLGGKTHWLRPGKSYTVGRMKKEADIVVDSKSVSRKHLSITVELPKHGAAGQTSVRSKLTIKDLDTSFGTFINNEKLGKGESQILSVRSPASHLDAQDTNSPWTLRVGKSQGPEAEFTVWWKPVVLTLSSGQSSAKHDELQLSLEKIVTPLDIKLLPVVHPCTTHFVKASEKNSAKILVALVKGLPVVTSNFIDALSNAADAMEVDFDRGFPDPTNYLPEPKSLFELNPKRIGMFAKRMFIFFDQKQYDSLLPMIHAAKGAAVMNTATKDIFIKNSLESPSTQVYIVRPLKGVGSDRFSTTELSDSVLKSDSGLGYKVRSRLIDQIDFLTAIQDADAELLDRVSVKSEDESNIKVKDGELGLAQTAKPENENMVSANPIAKANATHVPKRPADSELTLSFLSEEPDTKRLKAPKRRTAKIDMLDMFSVSQPKPHSSSSPNPVNDQPSADTISQNSVVSQTQPLPPPRPAPRRRRLEDNTLLNPISPKKPKLDDPTINVSLSPPVAPALQHSSVGSVEPSDTLEPSPVVRIPPMPNQSVGSQEEDVLSQSTPQDKKAPSHQNPSWAKDQNQEHPVEQLRNLAIVEASFPVRRQKTVSDPGNSMLRTTDYSNRKNFKRFKKSQLPFSKSIGFMEAEASNAAQLDAEMMFQDNSRRNANTTKVSNQSLIRANRMPTSRRSESPSLFVDDSDQRLDTTTTTNTATNSYQEEEDQDSDEDALGFRFTT